MEILTSSPELDEGLIKPENWANEDWIHGQLKWLRENDPLRLTEPDGFDPFWNVTKYHDIKEVEQNKSVFINDPRPVLGPKMVNAVAQQLSGRKHLVRSLVQMDDPDHMKYRRLTQGWFMGTNLRKLQSEIEALALLDNPAEMEKLKSNLEKLMPTFIDEIIRWVTPVRHFMRTATQDYTLRGAQIQEGESVILWYPSANRDEEVFDNPFDFKVDRNEAKQIAFGFGAHVCLGQHLARMEMSILFKKLLSQLEHIELAGEPKYTEATFVGGLKSLPIRYKLK